MTFPSAGNAGARYGLALCLLVISASAATAQPVTIAPRLRSGDEFRLAITRARKNTARKSQDGRSTTNVDVRIVEVTADRIALDWVPGDTEFDNPLMAQDPVVAAAAAAVGNLSLRIHLTSDGGYDGIGNEDVVLPKLQAAVDVIVRDAVGKMPEDQRAGFQKMLSQFLSPAFLLASATGDAQIYFGMHGVTLDVGEAVETRIERPSPLGGGVVPALYRMRVESATDSSAVLVTTTTFESAAFVEVARSIAAQAGKPLSPGELAKMPPIQMGDDGRYVFDRTVGLMREVTINRRMTAGPAERLDGWEFRLVKAPAR